MSHFPSFVELLQLEFGLTDPEGEAEEQLDALKMRDNQKLLKYNVEFQRLATRTSWDESALCHRYYAGLPDRIKDILVLQSKLKSLVELKAAAHTINTRYWECQ